MAPVTARPRMSRQEPSNRDSTDWAIVFSGSIRITAASAGSVQPARLAAARMVAPSERPDSSSSTSSSRWRSRSAPASDCSRTYPRADDEESWSTKTNTASASAASASRSTPTSSAACDTWCQATRAPTW
jgi:hypothetical protein